MIRNIFKSIEVLIDMYYHRKKLVTRYKRIKRYQRTGEIADVNKIDKIRDRDLKLLNDCLQEQLKTILKDAGVKADMFNNGTVGITIWYNGKPFTKRTCNYYDFYSNLNNCMDIIDTMVQEIKNQELIEDHTVNDNNYRSLKLLIEEKLKPILEGVEVNISGVCPGLIRVEVSYKGCTEWFKISDYMLKKELIAKILTKAKMIAYELPIRHRGLEVYESIKLNRLADEVKGFIREVYPNIEVELQKDSTGTIDKGHWLILKCHGVSSTEYVKRNSSKRMYLDIVSEFMIKVNMEIQRKQQEEDKKKALLKKNNPLNLKVGELYNIKYEYSDMWNLVSVTKITEAGFPYCVSDNFICSIISTDIYDVKTHDGKWIHNCRAWKEFQAKKDKNLRVKYTIPDYRELGLLSHKGIDLQIINH